MSDTTVSNTNPNANVNRFGDLKYTGEGRVSFTDGPSMSVMEAVSFLFMERSEVFSTLAKDKMQESQNNLNEIKEARAMLARMRILKQDAGKDASTMPDDMIEYCKQNKISTDRKGDDDIHNKGEWDVNIENMQSHLDSLTDSNQMQFLQLKSVVNKLEESVSAANKAVDKNHDAVKGILSR